MKQDIWVNVYCVRTVIPRHVEIVEEHRAEADNPEFRAPNINGRAGVTTSQGTLGGGRRSPSASTFRSRGGHPGGESRCSSGECLGHRRKGTPGIGIV